MQLDVSLLTAKGKALKGSIEQRYQNLFPYFGGWVELGPRDRSLLNASSLLLRLELNRSLTPVVYAQSLNRLHRNNVAKHNAFAL